ncbi:MAG: DnaA N-terminal domain-containing protein, partial [Acidimicrobiia bacterium]
MALQPVQPEEITRLWAQVLLSAKSRLESHQAFDTWFKPIVPRELGPQTVELEVPNAFFVD